jgi:tetratricopeptide (TPR) repeat protein
MSLILFLAAAAAGTKPATPPKPPVATANESKFDQCMDQIAVDANKAIAFANKWRSEKGDVAALQCLGLAYVSQQRWLSAMTAFEQAAQIAERSRDGRSATLWVLAGNAALAGGNPTKAQTAFDTALGSGILVGEQAGEAHLDRARAAVMLGDLKNARVSIDQAIKLVPADPLVWLLSATLARRQGDLTRAERDISEALKRSPDDASVALEAGNIAMTKGVPEAAKAAWGAAVRMAPKSPAGEAAAKALQQFEGSTKP